MDLSGEQRTIGGHVYTVSILTLTLWRQLQTAVWPVIVGLLPDLVERKEQLTKDEIVDVVASASVLLPLQTEAHDKVLSLLEACTRVDGEKGFLSNSSELFWAECGYAEFGTWLSFALEVQLVPFLKGLPLNSLRRLSGPKEKPSRSQAISTGMSGAL